MDEEKIRNKKEWAIRKIMNLTKKIEKKLSSMVDSYSFEVSYWGSMAQDIIWGNYDFSDYISTLMSTSSLNRTIPQFYIIVGSLGRNQLTALIDDYHANTRKDKKIIWINLAGQKLSFDISLIDELDKELKIDYKMNDDLFSLEKLRAVLIELKFENDG